MVITVNGIFKEICDTGEIEDNILAFSRTFVIKKFADGLGLFKNSAEYRIINEIVLFYRPSNKQINSYNVPMGVQKGNAQTELVTEDDEKCLMIIFNDLTGLVPGWCKKYVQITPKFGNIFFNKLFIHFELFLLTDFWKSLLGI